MTDTGGVGTCAPECERMVWLDPLDGKPGTGRWAEAGSDYSRTIVGYKFCPDCGAELRDDGTSVTRIVLPEAGEPRKQIR